MSDSGQKQSLSQSITSDFRATASLVSLRQRAAILSEIRTFFHQRQYWEVETPLLSAESIIDWHLEPFSVSMAAHSENQRFLQTSPEFAMKRLLAGGADRIYQICKAFRKEEQGPLHNPEFTILEWYACGLNDHQQMDFTEEMIQHLFLQFKQPLPSPLLRITYEQAFHDALGVSILDLDTQALKELAQQHGISFATESPEKTQPGERDLWLNLLLAEKVEPFLKTQHAVFLYHYPASQAALAKLSEEDARVAQRFELYIQGVEICNGYHELTDAKEFEQRSHEQNRLRQQDGLQQLPHPKRFLAAMQHGIPQCSGVALGIDRLVMLLLGHNSLPEVLTFPNEIA